MGIHFLSIRKEQCGTALYMYVLMEITTTCMYNQGSNVFHNTINFIVFKCIFLFSRQFFPNL